MDSKCQRSIRMTSRTAASGPQAACMRFSGPAVWSVVSPVTCIYLTLMVKSGRMFVDSLTAVRMHLWSGTVFVQSPALQWPGHRETLMQRFDELESTILTFQIELFKKNLYNKNHFFKMHFFFLISNIIRREWILFKVMFAKKWMSASFPLICEKHIFILFNDTTWPNRSDDCVWLIQTW